MSSRLTVNLGVRWEYNGYDTEKYGNNTNIWPSLILTVSLCSELRPPRVTGGVGGAF